jgi:hypothetical protein
VGQQQRTSLPVISTEWSTHLSFCQLESAVLPVDFRGPPPSPSSADSVRIGCPMPPVDCLYLSFSCSGVLGSRTEPPVCSCGRPCICRSWKQILLLASHPMERERTRQEGSAAALTIIKKAG